MSSLTSRPTRRRGAWVLLAVLLGVGVAVLSAGPAEAANHQVKIAKYAYGPSSLSVAQGDTVTWTNLDTVEHDVFVTNGPASFRSPMLAKGESWSHTFSTAGSYSYICSVHPDMRASVTVAAAPAPATSAPAHETHAPEAAAPSSTPAATTAATIAQSPAPAAAPASPTSTLNPLLLVAGASIAVVVFCLLLMASRPVYTRTPEPEPTRGTEDKLEEESAEDIKNTTDETTPLEPVAPRGP